MLIYCRVPWLATGALQRQLSVHGGGLPERGDRALHCDRGWRNCTGWVQQCTRPDIGWSQVPFNGSSQYTVVGFQNVVTGPCTQGASVSKPRSTASTASTKAASSTLLSFMATTVGQVGPFAPQRPAGITVSITDDGGGLITSSS